VKRINVDPSSYGIREYGTSEYEDVVVNDKKKEEINFSSLRAKELKMESNEMRENIFDREEIMDEIIMTIRDFYSSTNMDKENDESPTSLNENSLNVKSEYPEAPQPERYETREKVYHSITNLDYTSHINIPDRMFTIENLFSKDYCEKNDRISAVQEQ